MPVRFKDERAFVQWLQENRHVVVDTKPLPQEPFLHEPQRQYAPIEFIVLWVVVASGLFWVLWTFLT